MPRRDIRNIPYIEAFPHDNRLWRVDWFGQISFSPHKEIEPDVEVQISPFIGSPSDPGDIRAVKSDEQKIVRIGVGLLYYVSIGSVWKNGLLARKKTKDDYKYTKWHDQIEFTEQSMAIVKPSDKFEDRTLITNKYHAIASGSCFEASCLGVAHKGMAASLIIPQIELIRFYYFASEKLSISQFTGILQNASVLFDPENDADYSSPAPFVLRLPGKYRKGDTRILARIAASSIARRNAAKIHQSLMLCSANSKYLHPVTYPPFIGQTELRAYGKWIKPGLHWRFLVFSIESCSGEFPFNRLVALSDRVTPENNEETIDGDEVRKSLKTSSRKKKVKQILTDENSKIDSNDDSRSKNPDLEFLFNRERFTSFKKERVEFHSTKESAQYKPTKLVSIKQETKKSFTTGTSTTGGDAGNISFADDPGLLSASPVLPSLPSFLRKVYDGLCKFREDYPEDFNFQLVTITDEVYHQDIGPIQKVPIWKNDTRLSWAFCGKRGGRWLRRQILIAEAQYKNKVLYFFEAERRMKIDENGQPTNEDSQQFAALVVYSHDFSKVSRDDLLEIIFACAEKGYLALFDKELVNLRRSQMRHVGWTSSKVVAQKLKRKLDKLICATKPSVS